MLQRQQRNEANIEEWVYRFLGAYIAVSVDWIFYISGEEWRDAMRAADGLVQTDSFVFGWMYKVSASFDFCVYFFGSQLKIRLNK